MFDNSSEQFTPLLALQLLGPVLVGAAPARQLSGVVPRLDAPFAEREAGALELLRDQGVGRAVAGVVGTVFFGAYILNYTNSQPYNQP